MDTIQQMKQHVSVRHYQDKEIPVEVKQDLLLAAQSGSTSNFVQAYSITSASKKFASINKYGIFSRLYC